MELAHYYTNEELEKLLKSWQDTYPALVRLETLGASYEKRPIWIITLTNQNKGSDLDKPALWIDGNIHATEISGSTAALAVANELLSKYGTDDRITRLMDTTSFYIVPRLNPDGAEQAMAPIPAFIRSGVRPYPLEEREEGLHQQDIDKDGRILQMRIPDPNGDWKVSTIDPRLMEKRGMDEEGGQYYRLLPEGMIESFDGFQIRLARPYQGLDFNRNFPFDWRPEDEQSGAGPYPASEPEIRAVLEFIHGHHNINIAMTFHTFSRVILRPYSNKSDDEIPYQDLQVYKKIGERGMQLTGYRCVSTFHDFRYHPKEITTGAFDDWIYDHLGIYAFTIELWDLPTEAGIKDRKVIEWWKDHPHQEDVQILKWADEHVGESAYINWYPYRHPQLGDIELGGWNAMYTWRNPPPQFLANEVNRHIPFMLSVAEMMPKISIHKLDVIPLPDGIYHLVLSVENTGFLPTYTSEKGKQRQATFPVKAELELPAGAVLLTGKEKVDLGFLEGRSNKLDSGAIFAASPTDNRAKTEWMIKAAPGTVIRIVIKSERAGTIRKEISLI